MHGLLRLARHARWRRSRRSTRRCRAFPPPPCHHTPRTTLATSEALGTGPRRAPVRIARFTAGDDPQYGVVTGEVDDNGVPDDDCGGVAVTRDPVDVRIDLST